MQVWFLYMNRVYSYFFGLQISSTMKVLYLIQTDILWQVWIKSFYPYDIKTVQSKYFLCIKSLSIDCHKQKLLQRLRTCFCIMSVKKLFKYQLVQHQFFYTFANKSLSHQIEVMKIVFKTCVIVFTHDFLVVLGLQKQMIFLTILLNIVFHPFNLKT